MCENCVLHGEGTKWYLNPKNYGEKQYTEKEIHRMMGHWLAFWQFHQTMYERMRKYGAIHCMQVIPLEELFKVLDLVEPLIQVGQGHYCLHHCPCKQTLAGTDEFTCMGISLSTLGIMQGAPKHFSLVDNKTMKEELTKLNKKGLVHMISGWGMEKGTIYIENICNCELPTCTVLRSSLIWGLPTVTRAEYVAVANPEQCTGCGQCIERCQFGAITMSHVKVKVSIAPTKCFGCGLCQTRCPKAAINLVDRRQIPVAANLWSGGENR